MAARGENGDNPVEIVGGERECHALLLRSSEGEKSPFSKNLIRFAEGRGGSLPHTPSRETERQRSERRVAREQKINRGGNTRETRSSRTEQPG